MMSVVSASPLVPARVGGVDLSIANERAVRLNIRPRPCGRGGFKQIMEARKGDH